jgi:hypothetical protein
VAVISLTGLAALLFYVLQNSGRLEGGNIALPKLLWLAYAILFWFFLPALIVLDTRTAAVWRRIYAIFLVNMLLRGTIELYMMYVAGSWSPYYGIAHDLFTIVLLFSLVSVYQVRMYSDPLLTCLYVIMVMFATEIGFVFYMLSQVSDGEYMVYFVPGDQRHAAVLQITWLVNILLTVYLYKFSRRWVCEEPGCTGGRTQQAE